MGGLLTLRTVPILRLGAYSSRHWVSVLTFEELLTGK